MKRWIAGILLVAVICGTMTAQTLVDRIVAVVDKEIITKSELDEQVRLISLQNNLDASKPELRQQVLDAMITDKLILAQAAIDSIEVTDNEVSQALDQQIQNLVRQAGSEGRLEQYYGMPISRIKREFRDEMRKALLIDRVRKSHEGSIQVTPREVEEFYRTYRDSLPPVPEEVELSNIFVVPKPDSALEAATRGMLQSILDSIRAGGDFSDFARRYSKDLSASRGGELPPAKRGELLRDFEEVAFSLRQGEVSNVFRTELGYHIVKLIERRGEEVRVRQILLPVEKGASSDSAAVAGLGALRARVLAGESFADLARKYSEDEETKTLGGDLGRVATEQLKADFKEVVGGLKDGEISQPHRVTVGKSYGYQIVWLRKRISAHSMSLTDDYHRVEQLALLYKRNRENERWIRELKKSIYWTVNL